MVVPPAAKHEIVAGPRSGFALIVSLGLMSLVILLLVTLTAQIRVESSVASDETRTFFARNNALLGLQIALGELQRTSGPDQRATAAADILGPDGYAGISASPVARQWTGVWDSRLNRANGFLGWLVSAEDRADVEGVDAAAGPPGDRIELLGEGTLGSAAPADLRVEVPLASVAGAPEEYGRYAFWVADEGVKVRFQGVFPSEEESTNARRRSDFRLNQRNAIETYGDLSSDAIGDAFTAEMSDQPRSFARSELLFPDHAGTEVPSADLLGETFFDFSPYPVGLLTDARNGGWKKDLTWLFEEPDVAAELAAIDANPSFPGSQISADWPANSARSHWPAPPSWELLRDFYRMSAENSPLVARPQSSEEHGITPVVVLMETSFIPGLRGQIDDNGTLNEDDDFFTGFLRVYIDVRLALWNPYDSEIRLPESDLEILWQQNGWPIDSEWRFGANSEGSGAVSTFNANISNSSMFAGTIGVQSMTDQFYGGGIPCYGLSFRIPDTVFGPGEILVFTISGSEDGQPYSGANFLENIAPPATPTPFSVWLEHPTEVTSGSGPGDLTGEHVFRENFANFNTGIPSGGMYIHHIALRDAGTAFSSSNNDEYYGRFLSRRSPGSRSDAAYGTPSLGETIYGSTKGVSFASPTIRSDHMLTHEIYMQSPTAQFRSSRWARNYNPRASIMARSEADRLNNPLAGGIWRPSWTSGRFFNILNEGGKALVAARPELGNNSHALANVSLYSFPRQGFKPLNIADLRHANLHPHLASNNYLIGESLVDMRLNDAGDSVREPTGSNATRYSPIVDGSYLLNEGLWDGYFFSTIDGSLSQSDLDDGHRFSNARIQLRGNQMLSDFEYEPDRFDSGAALLEVVGQFNINSTSKEAWKAVLASSNGLDYDPVNDSSGSDLGVAFSRLLRPISKSNVREDSWLDFRELTEEDLESLALEIVRQVRVRGPFLTLADFVNRRIEQPADGQGLQGALAQAIDDAELNANSVPGQLDLPAENSGPGDPNWDQVVDWYIEEAVTGSRSAGATRWLMQGDLLSRIGGMIATRSDTFMIRSFGSDADEIDGSEIFLEAVVQRVPEAVESDGGDPFAVGDRFGRRFELVSYRVLDREDI